MTGVRDAAGITPTTTQEHTIPMTDPDTTSSTETGKTTSEWPAWATTALNTLNDRARRVVAFVDANPEGAFRLIGSAIGGLAMALLILSILGRLVGWAVTGDPLDDLAKALPAGQIAADPFMHWLTTHTTGLPITAETAAWIWGVTGALLWFAASFHHLVAKALWLVFGATTAAMVWAGTTTNAHRPVTTGLVVIAWTVLSLFVLVPRPQPLPRRRPAAS
ncbi:hypothetical protein ACFCV3_41795 [Kribbella sp. NPDC056345]|uniref:hypothetical protein n=1 Tax=Kribbella sp. NPDC056345 TaxID=3345789 RepID=UPI0035D74D98